MSFSKISVGCCALWQGLAKAEDVLVTHMLHSHIFELMPVSKRIAQKTIEWKLRSSESFSIVRSAGLFVSFCPVFLVFPFYLFFAFKACVLQLMLNATICSIKRFNLNNTGQENVKYGWMYGWEDSRWNNNHPDPLHHATSKHFVFVFCIITDIKVTCWRH